MNVSYKGIKQDLPPAHQEKLDAKFAKLSKLLERRGQREAHVVVTHERHLYHAEVTVQFYDHQLVGLCSDGDVFTALSSALDKLESQAHKQVDKFREKNRRKEDPAVALNEAVSAPEPEAVGRAAPRVFRVNHKGGRKPMTLDEALLEMEQDRDYLVYQDAEKQTVSVLVRRRDGHFDLIES
ncbi:MAG TPA: ribosome-associated translation inhibitor RaiA [Bryobacteraceae bacterium]|nr:ribosome-associated translation inhibitor RaiA [Bryobacteraceae bacterium]